MPRSYPFWAVLGLIVAFGWTFALHISVRTTHRISDPRDDLITICAEWAVVAILCAIAFGIQRQRGGDFGIHAPGWRGVLAAIVGAVVAFALTAVVGPFISTSSSLGDMKNLAAVPLTLRIALVATAAICEEFMYRGFAIEELAHFVGNRWLAGLLSLLFFTFAHTGLYGLTSALLIPGIIGAVLTVLYVWRRNLPSCMILHAIMDGV